MRRGLPPCADTMKIPLPAYATVWLFGDQLGSDPGARRRARPPAGRTTKTPPWYSNAIHLPSGDQTGASPAASRLARFRCVSRT